MNNTFLVWLAAMGALGLGLLLLLSPATTLTTSIADTSADVSVEETALFASTTEAVGSEEANVVQTTVYTRSSVGSCAGCAVTVPPTAQPIVVSTTKTAAPRLVGGCSPAYVPCAPCAASIYGSSCTSCASSHVAYGSAACRTVCDCCPSCSPCASCTSCASLCRGSVRPQINRNGPSCVAECTFLQLRTNLAQPVCGVCFRWSATKGSFLDPTASEPLYYAPPTCFACGEDVWITLVLTCADGSQYTDQICIHVCDNGL